MRVAHMDAPPPVGVIEGSSGETDSLPVHVGSASCVDCDGLFCSSEGPGFSGVEELEPGLVRESMADGENDGESESRGAVTEASGSGSGSDGVGNGTCSGGPAPIIPGNQVSIIISGSTVGGSWRRLDRSDSCQVICHGVWT
jgi:hypothetical protein